MASGSRLRLSIVYDSEALRGFETGWGFSALLSINGLKILFDCGWDGHILRRNLGRIGHALSDIRILFLSHAHWDHMGGLSEVLEDVALPECLNVIVHEGFSKRLREEIAKRATVTAVSAPQEIAPGVWSTGPLGTDIKEHALVVSTASGGVMLTGCAHPGVTSMLGRASELRPVTAIVGGLHSAKISEFRGRFERIVACHCTQAKAELIKAFPGIASIGKAGESYEFGR